MSSKKKKFGGWNSEAERRRYGPMLEKQMAELRAFKDGEKLSRAIGRFKNDPEEFLRQHKNLGFYVFTH